jgi:hypothetical protein
MRYQICGAHLLFFPSQGPIRLNRSVPLNKHLLSCHLLAFRLLFLHLLFDCVAPAAIAATGEVAPEKFGLLKVEVEAGCFVGVVQHWVDQAVVAKVAQVVGVPGFLVLLSYLFFFLLGWTFFTHLTPVEVI